MNVTNGIEFHDKANGGWFCNHCKQYLHADMVYSHDCKRRAEWKLHHQETGQISASQAKANPIKIERE